MNGSFERFTDRARRALTLAQEEAERFNHNYIGTEHLLLGLVREEDGVGAKVLSNFAIDLPKVRSQIEFIVGRGGGESSSTTQGGKAGTYQQFMVVRSAQNPGKHYENQLEAAGWKASRRDESRGGTWYNSILRFEDEDGDSWRAALMATETYH